MPNKMGQLVSGLGSDSMVSTSPKDATWGDWSLSSSHFLNSIIYLVSLVTTLENLASQ